MGVITNLINKPFNPRGNDQSPLAYNKAAIYSGKALDFDGVNDEVLSSITISGSKTQCVWINADGTNNERITSIFTGGYSNLTFSNNKFSMYDGTNVPETTTTFETNQWYFVVAVQEANNAKIYVNGISQPLSTTNWIEHTYTSATIAIGRDASSGSFYDGEISGARVFNTALTPAQVADLYNFPEKIVPTGVANTALKLWLPMQEGAGTTAYDGSGNGNHGTISGATYVNGVGAPVAQTAVIDWNKGTNLAKYSNYFKASGWALSNANGGTIPIRTFNYAEAPDGTQTATRIQMDRGTSSVGYSQMYQYPLTVTSGQVHVYSVWVKSLSGTPTISIIGDAGRPVVTLTNEWVRYSGTYTPTNSASQGEIAILGSNYSAGNSQTADVLVWGYQVEKADAIGSYVRTFATAQTSPVLLPQGLTAGRDITGVNLFENVRKQSALNLDGNSWAEVHDNASLDIVDEVTLELWYYHKETSNTEQLIGKRKNGEANWLRIYSGSPNTVKLERNGGAASGNFAITENAWNHITATIDSSDNMKFYIGGTQVGSASSFAPWGLNTSSVLSIGAWVFGGVVSNSQASGQIAQPRIYNRALTAEEVQRNYDAGKNIYS